MEASDLTLVSGDLRAAADAIRLSRATLRTIKQNLAWAFGYNIAVIPLAAVGLLNPVMAGAAMGFSSVSVVANALRLRRFRSQHGSTPTVDAPVATRGTRLRSRYGSALFVSTPHGTRPGLRASRPLGRSSGGQDRRAAEHEGHPPGHDRARGA